MFFFNRLLGPVALSLVLAGCIETSSDDAVVSVTEVADTPVTNEDPGVDAPGADAPDAEEPMVEMPGMEMPGMEMPEAPVIDTPVTGTPIEIPANDTPVAVPGNLIPWSSRVNAQNTSVMIPADEAWTLDRCDVDIKSLMIHGQLVVQDSQIARCEGAQLASDWIMIMGEGAMLQVGTQQAPLVSDMTFVLKGDDPAANANGVAGFMSSGTKTIMAMGGGALELHGIARDKRSWTQLDGSVRAGDMQITVVDTTGWQAGDQLVLAPSGYDVRETEELTIAEINGKSITLTQPLQFEHYGKVQQVAQGKTLDMRAEVGLLSRNIDIRGDAQSAGLRFGGHVMVMQGGTAHIEGVEFYHMGQQGLKGRYPFHWHGVGNAEGQWVRHSSVHKSFQRAFASHKTDNSEVSDNVAYHVANHAFVFAEDGDERGNRYIHNFGVYVYPPEVLAFQVGDKFNPSGQNGDRPGVFWGRSPNHILIGNHAGGTANGSGFFIDSHEAKEIQALTKQAVFRDNLAHSNTLYANYKSGPNLASASLQFRASWGYHKLPANGVFVDLDYPSNAPVNNDYNIDTDLANAGNVYEIDQFQTYKNGRHGVWTTERFEAVKDSVVADSITAMRIDAGMVNDSVIMGTSANKIGNPESSIMCPSVGNNCFGLTAFQLQGGVFNAEDITVEAVDRPFIVFDGLPVGKAAVVNRMTRINNMKDDVFVREAFVRQMRGQLIDIDGSTNGINQPMQSHVIDGNKPLEAYALDFTNLKSGAVINSNTLTIQLETFNSAPVDYRYYLDGQEVSMANSQIKLTDLDPGYHYLVARPTDNLDGSLGNRRGYFWFPTYFYVGPKPVF